MSESTAPLDEWTAESLTPHEALSRLLAVVRSGCVTLEEVSQALGLEVKHHTNRTYDFLRPSSPALFARLTHYQFTAPLGAVRVVSSWSISYVESGEPLSLLDLLGATGHGAALAAYQEALPTPEQFARFVRAVVAGGNEQTLHPVFAHRVLVTQRLPSVSSSRCILLKRLLLGQDPLECKWELTRKHPEWREPEDWRDFGFAPLDAALVGLKPDEGVRWLLAAGVPPTAMLIPALVSHRPEIALALARAGAPWPSGAEHRWVSALEQALLRECASAARSDANIRLALDLRAAGCPAPNLAIVLAARASQCVRAGLAASPGEALAGPLAPLVEGAAAPDRDFFVIACMDDCVLPAAATAVMRVLPPSPALAESLAFIWEHMSGFRPEALEAFSPALDMLRRPQLRRAARVIVLALVHAAYRPGGAGALRAQALFESAVCEIYSP